MYQQHQHLKTDPFLIDARDKEDVFLHEGHDEAAEVELVVAVLPPATR